MKFTLIPSLQHTALVKIATILWNQDDIRALISTDEILSIREWLQIEDEVIKKVKELSQLEPIESEIIGVIKPVGFIIREWIWEITSKICLDSNESIKLPYKFHWTPQGTIDETKMAQALIKDESLNITTRYKLACYYCLETEIPILWNKIPHNCRADFYSKTDFSDVDQDELVVIWTYDIEGKMRNIDDMIERWRRRWYSPSIFYLPFKCSPYQHALEYAASKGNKAATKYFLGKLTPEERKEPLVRSAKIAAARQTHSFRCSSPLWLANQEPLRSTKTNEIVQNRFPRCFSDVLCYLLSQMNEEQQMEVFKSEPDEALLCFLDWPWQNFFLRTAKHVLKFLKVERDFSHMLRVIYRKIKFGYKDYNYHELFRKFWKQSPDAYRRHILTDPYEFSRLVEDLVSIEDQENLILVLKYATPTEKENYSPSCSFFSEVLINVSNWSLLRFFMKEFIASKEFVDMFKKHNNIERPLKKKDVWNKLFQTMCYFLQVADKKRSRKEDCGPSKRLCSVEMDEYSE